MAFSKPALMLALFSWLCHGAPAFAEDTACHMQTYGAFDLACAHGIHTAKGQINGTPATFAIDTGATLSLLTPGSAQKFDLAKGHLDKAVSGVGGTSRLYYTQLQDFSIGDFKGGRRTLALLDSSTLPADLDGIIGADILLQRELEIDMAQNRVRFFRALHCEGHNLAYWDDTAPAVTIDKAGPYDEREVITVEVNGKPFRALLDSGAYRSEISAAAAATLGVNLDDKTRHRVAGVGGATDMAAANAGFDSITIGNERIGHPVLMIADLYAATEHDMRGHTDSRFLPDLILGNDFFMKHRLMLSESQRKLYYSYLGGPVFGSNAVTLDGKPGNTAAANP